ncbi:hypothetical protein CEXT_53361 [Caerostris extrusa]|uniref:LAGLIDADG homing endonuclease n=1 Tax=Caerostris extrusa TaxID=172846 RepID=A0AAV4URA1_CAEEX|nr:hypothetical protein CEXT_53361 [Caerostris extrusa]
MILWKTKRLPSSAATAIDWMKIMRCVHSSPGLCDEQLIRKLFLTSSAAASPRLGELKQRPFQIVIDMLTMAAENFFSFLFWFILFNSQKYRLTITDQEGKNLSVGLIIKLLQCAACYSNMDGAQNAIDNHSNYWIGLTKARDDELIAILILVFANKVLNNYQRPMNNKRRWKVLDKRYWCQASYF